MIYQISLLVFPREFTITRCIFNTALSKLCKTAQLLSLYSFCLYQVWGWRYDKHYHLQNPLPEVIPSLYPLPVSWKSSYFCRNDKLHFPAMQFFFFLFQKFTLYEFWLKWCIKSCYQAHTLNYHNIADMMLWVSGCRRKVAAIPMCCVLPNSVLFQQWYVLFLGGEMFSCCFIGGGIQGQLHLVR
jgi:hypothetical protein